MLERKGLPSLYTTQAPSMTSIQPDPLDTMMLNPQPKGSGEDAPSSLVNFLNALTQTSPLENFVNDMKCVFAHIAGDLENSRILLTPKDRERIYRPYVYLIIFKLTKKKVTYEYLKRRLTQLWKPTEAMTVIDLSHDYFIINSKKRKICRYLYRKTLGS